VLFVGKERNEMMNQSLWRIVIALSIAVVLVSVAHYFGVLHTPTTVE